MSSDALRAVALSEAVKLTVAAGSGDRNTVVADAEAFLKFLQGGAGTAAKVSIPGAEPPATKEGKPSANTAGAASKPATKPVNSKPATKPPKKTEEQLAAEALEKANAEAAAEGGEEDAGPSEPFEVSKEGISAAVAAMIASKGEPNRNTAIALLKKYKANSVSEMKAKDEATIAKFIAEVNEAFGLGGDPDLEG